jgi:heme-degrading monooxygenase HmoA
MHLAELNIARARYALDDPRMKDFVDRLDRVNAVAERSRGFVWRLKDEDGATIALDDDPRLIVNLSVWETAEDLEHFVWNTIHRQVYRRRAEWFPPLGRAHFVMWHVEPGTKPSVEEAIERLDYLNEHGSSDHAFGWEGLPHLKTWMEMRCA